MMLIFGPNETYFFDDGSGNRRWRAWPAFDKHMASKNFGPITSVAFGEGQTYWIRYKNGVTMQDSNDWEDPHDIYQKLEAWLFHENVAHNYGAVIVNLGPNGSFFASSNQGHRWRGLSESCSDYYQKFTKPDLFMRSRVHSIDFGYNGAYLGIGVDSTWFWSLGDEYPELSRLLGQKGVNGIASIYINPFAPNQHFLAYNDKTVHWSLPPGWMQDIQSLFQQYAARAGAPVAQAARPSMPSTSSGKWRKPSWMSGSANGQAQNHAQAAFAPASPTNPFATNYAAYPYAAHVQSGSQSGSQGGGSHFDFNQAMGVTQSALDAYNNAQGTSSSGVFSGGGSIANGLQMANDVTSNGLMIGQLVGQVGGAAAACSVM